ncbi:MAG TPA: hypothetical protein VE224_20405 [Pseudolabrys sp.]|nr:hypothetical protein [Pseudolabrys sp.]
MRHSHRTFWGVLLVVGLVGINAGPASARGGHHWDSACNCLRPNYQYDSRRVVRAKPRVVTRKRILYRTRVVRGRTRLIQENRLIVHVRPVINRTVIVHRTNTIVRDVVLHRVKIANMWRNEYHNQVIYVQGRGTVRHVTVYRDVRGADCNCAYRSARRYRGEVVSYRD